MHWVNWADKLLERMTRRQGGGSDVDSPPQLVAAPDRDQKLLVVLFLPVAAFWLLGFLMFSASDTLVSRSPDSSHRIIVREGPPGLVDRNFNVYLVDQQTGKERRIFSSDDQDPRISREQFVWSEDSLKVALVGDMYDVTPGATLPGGDIVFLMYDLENHKLWCNTVNDPKYPRISAQEAIDAIGQHLQ